MNNVKINNAKMNNVKVNNVKMNNVKVNNVKVNNVKVNNIKEKEKEKERKKWKQFKSKYTFLILVLLIYALRPLHINRNNEELSYMTEIINYEFNIENYKEKLNEIIRYITSSFITMNSNSREELIKENKTNDKILKIIMLLLNVTSYQNLYSKLIEYEPLLTNNKQFFNFILSLIYFSNSKKSLNREKATDYIIYLINRNKKSIINQTISQINTNKVDANLKNYKDLLIKVAESFFKNMVKNNSITFVNSKVVIKKNINEIPVNNNIKNVKNVKNENNNKIMVGGNNKSKSGSIKNMWWLKKYR